MSHTIMRCKQCGNTNRFTVNAVEHHTWKVDNLANFVTDIDCGDSTMSDNFCCHKCGSYAIEWVKEEEEELPRVIVATRVACPDDDDAVMGAWDSPEAALKGVREMQDDNMEVFTGDGNFLMGRWSGSEDVFRVAYLTSCAVQTEEEE